MTNNSTKDMQGWVKTFAIVISFLGMALTSGMSWQSAKDGIAYNTYEIARVDNSGCMPSFDVRNKLTQIQADDRHTSKAIADLEVAVKELTEAIHELKLSSSFK